jgi:hypothetical protein
MAHHQKVQLHVYNNWYLLFFLDGCRLGWIGSNPTKTTSGDLKRIISTNCCINAVVPTDDGA